MMSNIDKNSFHIRCIDHTITKEEFELHFYKKYEILETKPKSCIEELDKYYESEDYISHTDSKRSVFEKIYQVVKKYAINKKVSLITSLHKGTGNLLDIGAGTGDFLFHAKKNSWKISGVEPNDNARKLAASKNIDLDTNTSIYNDHSFDVITMWHVLEHVPDIEKQIKELKRLLTHTGKLVIAVPNFKSYDAQFYKEFWAAYDVPRHLWHFSKNGIKNIFEEQDFILEQILPMKFDAYYVSLLSEKYKNQKMNFFRAFWIGFLSNIKGRRSQEFSSHIYVFSKK